MSALRAVLARELVSPVAQVALKALDQWIGKAGKMAAGFPDLWVHKDAGVQPDDVVATLDDRAPPRLLHIAFDFDTEGTVVPTG